MFVAGVLRACAQATRRMVTMTHRTLHLQLPRLLRRLQRPQLPLQRRLPSHGGGLW